MAEKAGLQARKENYLFPGFYFARKSQVPLAESKMAAEAAIPDRDGINPTAVTACG
jgi:hypothetical protein